MLCTENVKGYTEKYSFRKIWIEISTGIERVCYIGTILSSPSQHDGGSTLGGAAQNIGLLFPTAPSIGTVSSWEELTVNIFHLSPHCFIEALLQAISTERVRATFYLLSPLIEHDKLRILPLLPLLLLTIEWWFHPREGKPKPEATVLTQHTVLKADMPLWDKHCPFSQLQNSGTEVVSRGKSNYKNKELSPREEFMWNRALRGST